MYADSELPESEVAALQSQVAALQSQVAALRNELTQNQAYYEFQRAMQLLEQAPALVAVYSGPHLILEFANAALREIFREQAQIGRPLEELFPDAKAQGFTSILRRAMQTGEPFIAKDVPFIDKRTDPPTEIWQDLVYQPIRDSDGVIRRILYLGIEVSARVREREALEHISRAQRMEAIGRLAGGIAHDLNNTLQVILASAEYLARRHKADSEAVAELNTIIEVTNLAAAQIRQLLMFARQQVTIIKPVELHEQIHLLAPLFRRVLGEQIDLVLQLMADPSIIAVDPAQLQQVLTNLVINARDALESLPTGTVVIETRSVIVSSETSSWERQLNLAPGAYVALAVRDTGVGIEPKNLPHVFEPFFTTKDFGHGTGLGLTTCYGILQQHKGTIVAESIFGHGTTITAYFPVSSDSLIHPLGQIDTDNSLLYGTEVVLLVEDEQRLRQALVRALSEYGYTVLAAANGKVALDLVQSYQGPPIQLLVTDVVMPVMGGLALVEQLAPMLPDLPVIYLSGYTDGAAVPSHQAIVVRKPFQVVALLQAVRATLEAKRYG